MTCPIHGQYPVAIEAALITMTRLSSIAPPGLVGRNGLSQAVMLLDCLYRSENY